MKRRNPNGTVMYKTDNVEFTTGWSGFQVKYKKWGYETDKAMLVLYPFWGKLFLNLPWKHKQPKRWDDICGPEYGVYYDRDAQALVISRGRKRAKFIYMPWALDWYRTSALMKDGETWEHELKGEKSKNFWDSNLWKDKEWAQTHTYVYTKKNGEPQRALARITVQEREWRRRGWFKFPWFSFVRRTIEIDFDREVGERAGSWKGGCVGCSYDIKPGETPLQTLRRMERERKF